jgi:endonuclease-3
MDPLSDLKALKKQYPTAKYYLNFSNPLELVVAAILSAQCRDEIVNATTKLLFKKYKTAKDFSQLDDNDIKSITFFKNKAKNIRETAKIIDKKYQEVPKTQKDLIELPGIGRKTAHAIMQNAFGIVDGIIVDTHVIRLANRLGWTENSDPEKIEQDLMNIFPRSHWKELPHLLKSHGRAVCKAPVPECSKCVLEKTCPKVRVDKKL